ncbi:MAG: hypothetical protein QME44_03865 [Thermodesulfobacteriota bacterium]|nr:hypothetical protein [Thermodesulfobacteriota bacterium]
MSGSLRNHWEYTPEEIWEPLAAHDNAPPDLFNDLYEAAEKFLALPTQDALFEEIQNDADKAHDAFCALNGTDFRDETAIVEFLEAAFDVIVDYDIPGEPEIFKQLLRQFISKYNLRYRLDDPFKLRFLLPWSFANLYSELQRLNSTNGHLTGLLQDFEHAFDRYARTQDAADLKTCIAKASNYTEGLASTTYGNPGTLGALCNQIGDWPHDKVKEALQSLYKFCSDYPGIRHAGSPSGMLRPLSSKDSTLVCLLLLGFTGYLSPLLDERSVLGV